MSGNSHQRKVAATAVDSAIRKMSIASVSSVASFDPTRGVKPHTQLGRSSVEAYVFFIVPTGLAAMTAFGFPVNFWVGVGMIIFAAAATVDLLCRSIYTETWGKRAKSGGVVFVVLMAVVAINAGYNQKKKPSDGGVIHAASDDAPALANIRDGLRVLGQKLDDLKTSPRLNVQELPSPPDTAKRANVEVYFGFPGAARGTVVTFNTQKDKESLYLKGAGGGAFNAKLLPGYLHQDMQQVPITIRNPSEVPIQNLSIAISSNKSLVPVTPGNRYGSANDLLYDFSDLPPYTASTKEITVIVQISTKGTAFDPTPLLVTVTGKGMSKHSEIMEYAFVPLPG